MSFVERINNDIKSAMLAKEKDRLAALRDIKSKLLLEATSGAGEVSEETAMKIVMKLHKQRLETYELYKTSGRDDLAAEEQFQADVIGEYLPKMMSLDEIKDAAADAIASVGASGPQDMGKVMGILTPKLAGKADGRVIADTVKAMLNN